MTLQIVAKGIVVQDIVPGVLEFVDPVRNSPRKLAEGRKVRERFEGSSEKGYFRFSDTGTCGFFFFRMRVMNGDQN